MDNTTRQLAQCAKDEVDTVLRSLAVAAAGGARAKPTMKQLNAMVASLENAQLFLKSALAPVGEKP